MVFAVNCCLNLLNMGGDIKYGCIGHGASCFMHLYNESLNSKKQFDFSKISLGNSGKLAYDSLQTFGLSQMRC